MSNEEVKHTALQNAQKNAFFAHPENILLAMLGDDNSDVRKHAVSIIQAIKESSANPDHNLASKSDEIECVNVR